MSERETDTKIATYLAMRHHSGQFDDGDKLLLSALKRTDPATARGMRMAAVQTKTLGEEARNNAGRRSHTILPKFLRPKI